MTDTISIQQNKLDKIYDTKPTKCHRNASTNDTLYRLLTYKLFVTYRCMFLDVN